MEILGAGLVDVGQRATQVGDIVVGGIELRHVHRVAVVYTIRHVGDFGATGVGAVVVGTATQGNGVVGTVVVLDCIGHRGSGACSDCFQLLDVNRIRIVCTGRQASNTTITDVDFACCGAADRISLVTQGAAVRNRACAQCHATVSAGDCAHADGH
ncbi:hypothetical protein D3C84_812740 [compost metagenome]